MIKAKDFNDMMGYLALLHPYTLVDIFDRPDDDEIIHTYVATGEYKASMADNRIFSGCSCEAIAHFNKLQTNPI